MEDGSVKQLFLMVPSFTWSLLFSGFFLVAGAGVPEDCRCCCLVGGWLVPL